MKKKNFSGGILATTAQNTQDIKKRVSSMVVLEVVVVVAFDALIS